VSEAEIMQDRLKKQSEISQPGRGQPTSGHFALQALPPQTVVEFPKIEIQEWLPPR